MINYRSKGKEGRLSIDFKLAERLRKIDLSKISEGSIQKAVQRACLRAKIGTINPHAFRHAFAKNYYLISKDIYRLKQLLNHSSIAITENYLRTLDVI